MFPAFRPSFGYISLFLGWSVFAVSACSPKESGVDSWKLSPPKIGLTNAAGVHSKVSTSDLRAFADSTEFADASSEFEFAPDDRALSAVFKSRCTSAHEKTAEHTQTLVTSANVPLQRLVHPSLTTGLNRTKIWSCDIRITVTNRHGSQSSGELRGIRVNFAPRPRISVISSESLIPNGSVEDLYHRKLFLWTIRNDQANTQTVFINAKSNSVRLAAVTTWRTTGTVLTPAISARSKFSATGVSDERQTAEGYYFRIAGGATATVYLSSNHPKNHLSITEFGGETSHLIVLLEAPLMLAALTQGQQSTPFLMIDERELDLQPRQPAIETALLTSTIWEPNPNGGHLAPAKLTFTELAQVKRTELSTCLPSPILATLPPCD